jgi:TRAP-type transport system periplasmic protein
MTSISRRRIVQAVGAGAALGVGSLVRSALAQSAPIELKLSHWLPIGHMQHTQVLVPWAEMVEKRSNGALKITIFPGAVLGKAPDHWDLAQNGIVDIAWGTHNYTGGRFPLTSAFDLPFLARSAKGGSLALWDYYTKHLQKEHASVKVLMMHCPPPFHLHTTKKPVLTPADLAGMRVRVAGGPPSNLVKALGGVPVALALPEAYNALERGVVDATIIPHEAMWTFKLGEVTKHHSEIYAYVTSNFLAMNLAKFDSLPAEAKKVLNDLSGPWASEFAGNAWDKGELPGIEAIHKTGGTIHKLTPAQQQTWVDMAKPVEEDWVRTMEAKGLPAKQALADLREAIKRHAIA